MNQVVTNSAKTSAGRFNSLLEILTPAERLVAAHLLQGLSNKEIAVALGKAEPTVKHQVSAILRAFSQSTRTRLIAFFHEHE